MNYKLIARRLRAMADEVEGGEKSILSKLENLLKTNPSKFIEWRNRNLQQWLGADTSTHFSAASASEMKNEMNSLVSKIKEEALTDGWSSISICAKEYSQNAIVGEKMTGEEGPTYIFYSSVYDLPEKDRSDTDDSTSEGKIFNDTGAHLPEEEYIPEWEDTTIGSAEFDSQEQLIEDWKEDPIE